MSEQTMKSLEEAEGFKLGDRVADAEGYVGTIRYLGPVSTSKNPDTTFVGVEWDEKEGRGKHDGSVRDETSGERHRYFECSGPEAGSLVKPTKISKNKEISQALKEKYRDTEQDGGGTVTAESGEPVEIVFVGTEKIREQQKLDRLWNISLKNCGISHADDGSLSLAPNLTTLDLRNNLFSEWTSIKHICDCLPKLETLNLAGNQLPHVTDQESRSMRDSFPALKVLILSFTGLNWQDIQLLEQCLPALEELHLVGNGIGSLHFREDCKADESIPGFSSLKVLSLMDNDVDDWHEIWRLRALPALEKLMLSNNKVSNIFYTDGDDAHRHPFESLQALSISGTLIDNWESLDILHKFPSLHWLRAQNLPLFEKEGLGPKQARLYIIARVPNIKTLNGSDIRPRERLDEEQSYVCMVADTVASEQKANNLADILPEELRLASERRVEELVSRVERVSAADDNATQAQILRKHPRFFELLGKHGDIIVGNVSQRASSDTLGSNVVSLTIRSMAGNSCMMDPVQRKLPLTMTVGQLKQMAARSFKMDDVSLLRLSYRETKNTYPDFLDNDMKPLSFYGVSNNGEILVEEVDPEEALRQEKVFQEDLDRRSREQESTGNSRLAAHAAEVDSASAAAKVTASRQH
eukprot:gb/GECG01002445.1/.p1 GENE.gb/GECG01002445.1/~~gb/GECG01002445.1/.p1  ORF type:complete len:639 (+),score=99.64 gb/GECG01002445.1/:1-1917(+)